LALLIDPPSWSGRQVMWSHLASDQSFDELHAFAATCGIPRRGFDRDHYDVPASAYDDLLAAGARPVTSRELVTALHASGLRRRKAATLGRRGPGQPLLRPPRLHAGDRVAVVAPAGPVVADAFTAGLAVLESWGLAVEVAPHVRVEPVLGHLAAADADRAADLQRAWCDPGVAAIICARGGYGAQRVVDLLDWPAMMSASPCVLAGFSDITALHEAFARVLGVATLHSPVVTSLAAADDESAQHLRRTLFAPETSTDLVGGAAVHPLVGGAADGVLVGGNLAVLAADAGTATSRPARGGIAVLEDQLEPPYRVDRLLTQLLRAGWFDGVRAVALGAWTQCGPAELLDAVLTDRLAPLGVPVLAGLPVGHIPGNRTVPLGVPARLDADAGTLTLREAALR
jgi:muramoyltetrapeptide carboxypeptidase